MREPDPPAPSGEPAVSRELTVAAIRERPGADHVQVAFLESARFYRLSKDRPGYEQALGALREARDAGRPVTVGLASLDGDEIESVR